MVLDPFRMALFTEPSLRAWTYLCRNFDFLTPSWRLLMDAEKAGLLEQNQI
jgi:hypothetical protein